MSRLMSGVLIVLFVLIVNLLSAFIISGTSTTSSFVNCSGNNSTQCEETGKTGFFSALAQVTFTGIEGAPLIVNAIWLTTMGLLLTAAILLIVLAFAPTTSE